MSNIWSAFDELVDKTQIRVATIMAHVGTESIVEDGNSHQYRVPGTDYDIGALVYIQNGVVISLATSLASGGTHYV